MDLSTFDQEDQVAQISFICPDVDHEVIRNDLLLTNDVDITVNRILDGRVFNKDSNPPDLKSRCFVADVNSDRDVGFVSANKKLCTNLNGQCNSKGSYQNLSDTDVNSDSDLDLQLPGKIQIHQDGTKDDFGVIVNQDTSETDINSDTYSDIEQNSSIIKHRMKSCKVQTVGNKRQFELSDNSEDEVDGLINLEKCGSLRQRILATKSQHSQPKRWKNEINHNEIHRISPITLTDTSNDSVENNKKNNGSRLDKNSPLTISDQSNDICQTYNSSDSENEILVIERESLSALLKKNINCAIKQVTDTDSTSVHSAGSSQVDFLSSVYTDSTGVHSAGSSQVDSLSSVYSSVDSSQTSLGYSGYTEDKMSSKKGKRSKEDIEERKKHAQAIRAEKEKEKLQKKIVRDEKLAQKEREKQVRNAERERKKQLGLNSMSYVKVILDPHIVNDCGLGAAVFNACEKLGVLCLTEEQRIPYTVCWRRTLTECSINDKQVEKINTEVTEDEVISVLPVSDFVEMVHSFKQKQLGNYCEGKTLREYVQAVQSYLVGKLFTMVVIGMEKYFRDQKTMANRQHREAVTATDPSESNKSKKQKKKAASLIVSRVDVEEAVTDTQLQTCSMVYMMETGEEMAELIRTYTKAVAEKPAKKDRLTSVFSFHEEGTTGVKVDKSGHGLLKVWKQQLMQFKNISPDIAEALIGVYPSPWLLVEAYKKCTSEREAIKLLENIVVRRGAGVLETTRRVGKELSRRIYTSITCTDPSFVIK